MLQGNDAAQPDAPLRDAAAVRSAVEASVAATPVVDVHTHLYPPSFGTPSAGDAAGLMLWGIDDLLTYHYLIAEVFRVVPPSQMPYDRFWRMSKRERADHVWQHLFVERSPVSEACRGVVTTLSRLGLDPSDKNPDGHRAWYAAQKLDAFIDRVMRVAGVESITMTNNVFDDNERARWLADPSLGDDPRFPAVVRLDPLVVDWPGATSKLAVWGYNVTGEGGRADVAEVRRFVGDWIDRTKAIYAAASLPPTFGFPDDSAGGRMLADAILPECRERGLATALMIGARRAVNPLLRDAGDAGGSADVAAVGRLCAAFPDNQFLVTLLARENQHELAVLARKFPNLMIFGCWWFLNNPSLIEEITRMRVELLGLSFIPQHSDARVLDQLVYKWHHSRVVLGKVLGDKYADLHAAGWPVTTGDVRRDVRLLFSGNFREFLRR